jgi:hypothetical protein
MKSKFPATYPFVPRSTAALVPGQFWAIPLSDGSFGCGRVIELKPPGSKGARVSFLAGVLNWRSEVPPASCTIAGAKCLDQGVAHLKAITETGGSILGHRLLHLDHIESWEFRGAAFYVNSHVYKGLRPMRPQQPSDTSLPVLRTWGYHVPVHIAEAAVPQYSKMMRRVDKKGWN